MYRTSAVDLLFVDDRDFQRCFSRVRTQASAGIQYLKTSISDEQRREFDRLVATTIGQIEAAQFPAHSGIRFPQNGCMSCAHLGALSR